MKKMGLFCLLTLYLLSALPMQAFALRNSVPVVVRYSVTAANGQSIGSITKGSVVTIKVSVKDTGSTLDQIGGAQNLDATRLVDSFTGGSISVSVTSGNTDMLTYDVTFSGVTYNGAGKQLRFMCGYKASSTPFVTLDVTIAEAVEYEPPKFEPSVPSPPDVAPPPMVLMSRSRIDGSIQPGQEIEVTITFQNLSNITIKSPIASITTSDSLMLSDGASSFSMPDIPKKGKKSIFLRIKATDTISAAIQSLSVEMKFNYYNNVALAQASVSDRLTIPAQMKIVEKNSQPPILITRSALQTISATQLFDLTLTVKNAGKIKIDNAVASVSTSDSLILQNETSSFILGTIKADGSQDIHLKIKVAKELTSSTQNINMELKFSYTSGDEVIQASVSERLNLSSNVTPTTQPTKIDSPVPSIIITQFNYGGSAVSAGGKLPLSFTFKNTGRLPTENIVVTVDGGESFTIDGSTNTFYYDRLAAGAERQQSVNMQVLPAAKNGAQGLGISFKYEYVDASKRASSTAEIKLSVPVYQPNRFQINAPILPEVVTAGEELTLSLPYVNKGKTEISNVEAILEGAVETATKVQYLGNIESGKSGTIGFIFTPTMPGETMVTLRINYEDGNQQATSMQFPVMLNVQESIGELTDASMNSIEQEPPARIGAWVWILLIAVVLLLVFFIRRRKKKKVLEETDTSWDAWEDEDENADEILATADTQQEN